MTVAEVGAASTSEQLETSAVSVNDALGGTQAVQDFAIYLGMWKLDDGSITSFYPQVVELAKSRAEGIELSGGFELQPVVGLEADVVDERLRALPSLSIDYGLMTVPDGSTSQVIDGLVEGLPEGSTLSEDLSQRRDVATQPLVVEIINADFKASRTHVGSGDRVSLDLTQVESLAPGDEVAVTYLFGQTLPGDATAESGLSAMELFHYRWDIGNLQVLGVADGDSLVSYTDYAAAIVDGSTKMTREAKEALLGRVTLGAFDDWSEALRQQLTTRDIAVLDQWVTGVETRYALTDEERMIVVEVVDIGDRREQASQRDEIEDCISDEGEVESRTCFQDPEKLQTILPFDAWIAKESFQQAMRQCAVAASQLNRQNAAATPVGEILRAGRAAAANEDAGDSGDDTPDDFADALDPQPGPVSCGPPPEPLPKVPSGATWGDIHLGTMDGKRYSNQAAGEFLLFENDATAIQVRTEPAAGGVVSVATAFAFTMGGDVVSLHAGGTTRINGEVAQLERGIPSQVGDGELLWWSGGWVAVWPDGTILRVNQSGSLMFSSVTPSNGATTGMLGNNDGDPDNDFFTRDGELLNADADEDFEGFYSTYVDSWRINPAESLFYYGPGESTDTFTIEGVPVERVTAEDLPAGVFAEAEEVCTQAGVASEDVLEMCILDVGVTGDPAFAYESYLAQAAIGDPQEDVAAEPPSVSGEGDNVLTVGDLMIAFGSDPPIQDPSGPRPTWTCESADGVYTAISRFQETPTIRYELDLQYISPDNPRGLDEQFRLIVLRNAEQYAWVWTNAEQFADSVDFVEIDGDALTASGEMFLNDPLQPGLGPISQLPAGTELDDFELSVSCGAS